MLEYLLENGADIDSRDRHNYTSLRAAIGRGHVTTAALLLLRGANADVDEVHRGLSNASTGFERLAMAKLLVEHGIVVRDDARAKKLELLHLAVRRNQLDMIDCLLDAGFNVDGHSEDSKLRATPLCEAAKWGKLEAARLLIARGASVDGIAGAYGTTPLMEARWHSRQSGEAVVDLLVREGANVNICCPFNEGSVETSTALTGACWLHSIPELVGKLLGYGADVNLGRPTPVERALQKGSSALLKLLLDAGADVDLLSVTCMRTLREIAHGSIEKDDLDRPRYRYEQALEKLRLLVQHEPRRLRRNRRRRARSMAPSPELSDHSLDEYMEEHTDKICG